MTRLLLSTTSNAGVGARALDLHHPTSLASGIGECKYDINWPVSEGMLTLASPVCWLGLGLVSLVAWFGYMYSILPPRIGKGSEARMAEEDVGRASVPVLTWAGMRLKRRVKWEHRKEIPRF